MTALSVQGSVIPGFSIKTLGPAKGFLTSVAVDSKGIIYYTTQDGGVFRLNPPSPGHSPWTSVPITRISTVATGNAGLLGMALRDDSTAAIHYTTPVAPTGFESTLVRAEVVSWIDLQSGKETLLHTFIDNVDAPDAGVSSEHHGGNPAVAPDGSIFVGIGDLYVPPLVTTPGWTAGRVFQVFPDGSAREFASGFRNPYDLVWDDAHKRLIVPDNGKAFYDHRTPDEPDDEINVIHAGDNAGWPSTSGNAPPCSGCTPPLYVFPTVIAPTGIVALSGRNPILQRGYLLCGFISKEIYYLENIDERPLPTPIAIIKGEPSVIVDVAEGGTGNIIFATPNTIYELKVPVRGDCNGDGLVNADDLTALMAQLAAGSRSLASTLTTTPPGSFGCDVDGDGSVTSNDVAVLISRLHRTRSVRGR